MDFKNLKWLHDLGFAVHWLHPNSKRPIGDEWQQGPRLSFKDLEAKYKKGFNVGVRSGEPSKLSDGSYLAILDIDVKSEDIEDAKLAYSAAETFIGKKLSKVPTVQSGRGGYSLHAFVRTKSPQNSFNLIRSKKRCKVLMPSVKPGKSEKSLAKEDIEQGYRVRPAFEIDVLGTGKQAALPPSIHPDSKKCYKWKLPIAVIEDLPPVNETKFKSINKVERKSSLSVSYKEVDLDKMKLSNKALRLIKTMDGLDNYGGDRSAALFGVLAELVQNNYDDDTIVSLLADPMNDIAEVAIDRVGSDFHKCAEWLLPQIEKVRFERSPENLFADTPPESVSELLSDTDWEYKEDKTEKNKAIVDNLGGWRLELDKNQNGGIKMNLKNTSLYLRRRMDADAWLGRNEFTGEIEFTARPPWISSKKATDEEYKGHMIDDNDVVECSLWLSKAEKFEPSSHLMLQALIQAATRNSFHPVRDWLTSLEWDGENRIDTWFHDYLGADKNDYTSAVGKKLLLAAIHRVMKPGCKFDHVIILEGLQGIGKSTALKILSDPWFCDSLGDVTNKDVIQQMQGAWIIEIGELASFDKTSMNAFKDFVSKREDKARLAYQRLAKKFPRQCVFIGTTNDDEYLKDTTGNRRFWPVEIHKGGRLEVEMLEIVKDQLWAEAFELYKKGTETLWLDNSKVKSIHAQIAADKMVTDPWDELIQNYVEKEAQKDEVKSRQCHVVSFPDVWKNALGKMDSSATKYDQMRATNSLKKLGYKRKRTDGKSLWSKFLT